jgi:hypothetical protein
MTLPQPPTRWDIKQLTTERALAVAGFGFTERQGRFLVEVMIHSGVFVPRQYCTFAGIVHGQKTHDFLRKLVERGYAVPIQVGGLRRGRIFHVRHKPIYAAIGQTDNRHRKPAPLARLVERLMILDAVLADRTVTWLGTEADKIAYIKRIDWPPDMLEVPQLTFGSESTRIVRYFPDKLPIGIDGFPIEHVLLYLVTNPDPDDFRLFLGRHAQLLKHLHKWIIRVLVPQPFAPAITRFGHAAREELATPLQPITADELRWFFPERQRREQHADESAPIDEKRFRQDCFAFRTPRYRMLFRLWQQIGDLAIWNAQSPLLHDALDRGQARVEFVRLSHQYLHLSRIVGVA